MKNNINKESEELTQHVTMIQSRLMLKHFQHKLQIYPPILNLQGINRLFLRKSLK